MQTYTGKALHLDRPLAAEICIEDIAHALSLICRFTGHVRRFYSVAEHSLLVLDIVEKDDRDMGPSYKLQALLHDATEAYMSDLNKPLKSMLPEYKAIERRLWSVICEAFRIPVELPPCIKHADLVALATERRDLMTVPPFRWDIDEQNYKPSDLFKASRISPRLAKKKFLEAFRALHSERLGMSDWE